MRSVVLVALTALTSIPALSQSAPAGAQFDVRLLRLIEANAKAQGTTVRAFVLTPVLDRDRVAIAPGTIVEGIVDSVGIDRAPGSRHFVAVRFDALVIGDQRIPITARVTRVDVSRESVDSAGRILGPPLASLAKSRTMWVSLALGTVNPIAATVFFRAIRGEQVELHRRIELRPGFDLRLTLNSTTELPAWPAWTSPAPLVVDSTFEDLIRAAPRLTTAANGRVQGGWLNVVFVGDEKVMRSAFAAAGWDEPDKMSIKSDFETFIRAALAEGYEHQPVSRQTLFGRPPDLVEQRVADTFAKRHHMRIWRAPFEWKGQAVWLANAIEDVGVTFTRGNRGFTHRTSQYMDAERDKVLTDLVAAGQVAKLGWLTFDAPNAKQNPAAVISDWRAAVVVLGRAH